MRDLLTYLASIPAGGRWRQWRVQRIGGSANNIFYRATGSDSDLAVKFTIRDARGRAHREYNALEALRQAGLDVAPQRPSAPLLPRLTTPSVALAPTPLTSLRRPGSWASVDWENAGWGDPAFEIVDLMCHPQYHSAPMMRWQWVIAQYAEVTGDITAVARIHLYYPLMLVWWAARLARMLYEVPLGLDRRLVARRADWQSNIQARYNRYVRLATAALDYYPA